MQSSMFEKTLSECTELQLMGRYISATGNDDTVEQAAIEAELESRTTKNEKVFFNPLEHENQK